MVQAQVMRLLKELVRDLDLGLLLISHDLSVLGEVCDEVAVMYAGRIVERAPARDAFQNPAHPYSTALAAAFPTIGDRASRLSPSGLPGDPPFPSDLPVGCPFAPRCVRAEEACRVGEPELEPARHGGVAACFRLDPVSDDDRRGAMK
jgi:peptide/nickel transport system ATP-binding protein